MLNQKGEKMVVANFKMNLAMKYEVEHWLANFKKQPRELVKMEQSWFFVPQLFIWKNLPKQ